MSKVHFGKNMEGGVFIWLDDPIMETKTVVDPHYPTAYIFGNNILKLCLETYSSLLSNLRNMHPNDINTLRESLGGTEKIRKTLADFRERKIRNGDSKEEVFF